jgi:spore germination cell wall hydrolase CwlJ-like protein
MKTALKMLVVTMNCTVLTFFGFFAFLIIDDGQAGSITQPGPPTPVTYTSNEEQGGFELIKLTNDIPPQLISRDPEAICMALNIYYESRSDNLAGQYAVADVVLNRMQDNRYPNTVCEVIKQGPVKESWKTKKDPDLPESERIFNPIRHMCQFSWWCDGKSDEPSDETGWAQAQYVAGNIMYNAKYRGITEGATHYHATYVKPKWRFDRGMNHIGRIGSHIFYRWD